MCFYSSLRWLSRISLLFYLSLVRYSKLLYVCCMFPCGCSRQGIRISCSACSYNSHVCSTGTSLLWLWACLLLCFFNKFYKQNDYYVVVSALSFADQIISAEHCQFYYPLIQTRRIHEIIIVFSTVYCRLLNFVMLKCSVC